MSMIVASSYSAGRARSYSAPIHATPSRSAIRGLRGGYVERGESVPSDAVDVAMVALRRDASGAMLPDYNMGLMGRPLGLAAMYARAPLLWLLLLFGSGWLGGYLTWAFIGRRRR